MDDLAQELYTQKENAVAAEVGPLVTSLRAAAGEVRVAAEILAAGDVAAGAGAGAGAAAPAPARPPPSPSSSRRWIPPWSSARWWTRVTSRRVHQGARHVLGGDRGVDVRARGTPPRGDFRRFALGAVAGRPPLPRAAALVRPRRGAHAQARMDPRRVPGGGSQRPATLRTCDPSWRACSTDCTRAPPRRRRPRRSSLICACAFTSSTVCSQRVDPRARG